MTSPGDSFIAALAKQTDDKVDDLQSQLRDQRMLQKFFAALSDALDAGRPSEALRVLAGSKKQFNVLSKLDPESALQLEALRNEIGARVADTFEELPRTFPAAINNAGLALDPSSRHPKYSLLDEFIEVRFDKRKLETTVLPRDGRKTVLGVEPDAVADHLVQDVNRLTRRPFDAQEFLRVLASAYSLVSKASGVGPGANVPLKELIAELAKDKDFQADEFNIDLSKLIRDKASAGRLSLDNARDPKNGILLWQLDQRGYYGYIQVKGQS